MNAEEDLIRRRKYIRDAPALGQQALGDRLHITTRDRIGEQQLEQFMIGEGA